MPVIPSDAGQQVLNAGSPVPVASSENERMFGEAVAYLGEGLLRVGQKMQDNRDSLLAEIASEDYQAQLIKESLRQTQEETLIDDDRTGLGAADAVLERASGTKDKLASSNLENDRQRLMFSAKAKGMENNVRLSIAAKTIEARAKQTAQLMDVYVAKKAQSARLDPAEVLTTIGEVSLKVQESQDIPEDKKPMAIIGYGRQVFDEAINGMVERGEAEILTGADTLEFEKAYQFLNDHGAQFYGSKLQENIVNLKQAEQAAINNYNGLTVKREQALQAQHRLMREKTIVAATKMKQVARNDFEANKNANEWIFSRPELSLQDKENLTSTLAKKMSEAADTRYEVNIVDKAVRPNANYGALIAKVSNDQKSGLISDEKSTALMKWLEGMQEKESSDPTHRAAVLSAIDIIEAERQKRIGDPKFDAVKLEEMVADAKLEFYKMESKNPNASPSQLKDFAYRAKARVFPAWKATRAVRGIDYNDQDLNGLTKAKTELATEFATGKPSVKRKQEIMQKLKEINQAIEKLNMEKRNAGSGGQQQQQQPSSGFAPGTR